MPNPATSAVRKLMTNSDFIQAAIDYAVEHPDTTPGALLGVVENRLKLTDKAFNRAFDLERALCGPVYSGSVEHRIERLQKTLAYLREHPEED